MIISVPERCSGRCFGDAMAAVGGLERCSGHYFVLCAERCSGRGRAARRWRSGVASCGLVIGWATGDYVARSHMVGGEVLQGHACAVLLQGSGKAERCSGWVLHMAVALQMLRRMHGRLTSAKPLLWDPALSVPLARRACPCWHDLRMVFTVGPWPWATTTLTRRICAG